MPSLDFVARRFLDTGFRLLRSLEIKASKKTKPKNLAYFPLVESKETLSDLLNRTNWYFPEKSPSLAQITVPVSKKLLSEIKGPFSLNPPEGQENFIKKNSRIKIMASTQEGAKELAEKSDAVMLWDFTRFYEIPYCLLSLAKIWVVDKNYFLVTEARNYVRLLNATIPGKKIEEFDSLGKRNFSKLMKTARGFRKAYAFGTGPSIARAREFDFSDGFRVVANTVLNDAALTNHIKPHAIIFGDFVYHIGPSKYAAKFMEQMADACSKGMFGIVRTEVLPLVLSHHPELSEKMVSIPLKLFSPPNIPDEENYFVKLSNNSLVTYMLPFSCSAVDYVAVLGCDGRNPKDEGFWGHAKTTHFDGLKDTIRKTHPSVFRDTDYHDFYEANARDTEEFIYHAESKGKRIECLAPSFIPALAKRQAPKYSKNSKSKKAKKKK